MDVLLDMRGPAAWVTLNRPQDLNALNRQIMERLAAILDATEADPAVRCLVITGAGRAFCAGADLKFIYDMPREERDAATMAFLRQASTLMSRVEAYPKPVIAAVNGIATAGGLELVLCCDSGDRRRHRPAERRARQLRSAARRWRVRPAATPHRPRASQAVVLHR